MQARTDAQARTNARTSHRRRTGLWITGGVVVVVGAATGAAIMLPVEQRAPAGTYLAGTPLGGLDQAQVRTAITDSVAPAVQAPIRLQIRDDTVTIQPAEAGITLDQPATERAVFAGAPKHLLDRLRDLHSPARRDIEPVLAVDTVTVSKLLTAKLRRFQQPAKDARMSLAAPEPVLLDKGDTSFTAQPAHPNVIPAKTGTAVDVDAAVNALRSAVQTRDGQATLTVKVVQPEVATTEAAAVDQLIGTFTTQHPCCAARVTNIHRIAELVDGSVIAPGRAFSLNKAAGRRTSANGFVSAPAIADGELVQQFGGGVSQFSTTLFNAAWFAGLDIVKHQPHSKYISRYPPGREATLDYDTIDQVIHNDTDAAVLIRTSTTATSVTVALYGHTGDREVVSTTGPRIPRTGGGFSVTVRRVVRDSGADVSQATLNWSYIGLD